MRGERTPGASPTRRRAPRSGGSVSVENCSTCGKIASPATSSESCSGTRDAPPRAVEQEEAEASVDSESSSCSLKLAECDSERRPFDTCVDESKTLELNRGKRSNGTRPSVGTSSTDGKIAGPATSCESWSGTRGIPPRAVKQGEAKASVDRKSSSCSSKLAECDSERRPFDTCVDESKTLESYSDTRGGPFRDVKQGEAKASVDRKSSSCSWKLAGCDSERRPFDICLDESKRTVFTLRPSLLELNREKRRNCQKKYLRPGMVSIIKICRELGIGAGGFYTPGYSDGAKLHLLMMCLGKNWDPETSSYEEKRFFDGAIPPEIPRLFKRLVENAIRASHDFLVQEEGVKNVEEELPWMSPDICIANFYSNSGKLGLHQDKDESKSSLVKGLPVVSFSLGDSAEFLYGVERDAAKAERIELESGDVLLFGGKSRNIFHGVPCIKPKTAPKRLIEDSNLRPGRLNLTFRQY
uniref:Fe2OG dioxygenase domain-containing protein n=1 Tax=Ananas comosus var. bracteatus TaxID=296719 RepID=A0A6V7NGR4_ANACO|nr:unnamed protein product [Ananas comosus var. bracteatus]